MEMKDVNRFIECEIQRLEEYYKDKDKNELTMAMTIKVIEEIGELFQEILSHGGYQRKDKLDKLNKKDIEKEFADVMITLLILAKRFDVNIEDALKIKIEEIKNRTYKK
jgi:NTP pyrophosphatase (non-canonical NTP hydrolase)